jgi:arylsulfatase A-like enzyme
LSRFPAWLHDQGYETGFIGKWHMGEDDTPRPGFDYWLSMKGHGAYFDPQVNENGTHRTIRGYLTDIFNEHAVRFMKKEHEKPYCLWLAHKAVNPEVFHNPDGSTDVRLGASLFSPAERHKKLYANVVIPRRPNYLRQPSDKPALLREIGGVPPL